MTSPTRRTILACGSTSAGLEGLKPRDLRHTAAKLRRELGASIEGVSAFLGHRSIATTAKYLARMEVRQDNGWQGVARPWALHYEGPFDRDDKVSRSTGELSVGPCSHRVYGSGVFDGCHANPLPHKYTDTDNHTYGGTDPQT